MVSARFVEYRETRMKSRGQTACLYAAVHAAEFPAQAILRLRPDLRSHPCVVLAGSPPEERVCALNLHARKRGVVHGMTRLEVEELTNIHILACSAETEATARNILLETLSQFSPRIEETFATNASAFVLDITGTERLFGTPHEISDRIRNMLATVGFRASICISTNFDTARIKAEFSTGISVIPNDKESEALAHIPISALHLELEYYETFALWGIGTLGELAALPEEELIPRFGQPSRTWLALSRGYAEHTFQPMEARFELKEHIEFETHIEQLDSLLFVCSNMINNLVARASSRALSLASIRIDMLLEGPAQHKIVIHPAIPSNDRKFLLKLMQLEIAAHPPQAAVVGLTLTAEAGQHCKVQLDLFALPMPEPSRLDVTLARLKAIAGADRVGSPVLLDSHRPGIFQMREFSINNQPLPDFESLNRTCVRRVRPPHHLRMQLDAGKPVAFRDGSAPFCVSVAYGPWQSSGCWWAVDRWDLEEWDVMATNNSGESVACLVIHDHLNGKWLLDAYYD
jgi:protein ImuB